MRSIESFRNLNMEDAKTFGLYWCLFIVSILGVATWGGVLVESFSHELNPPFFTLPLLFLVTAVCVQFLIASKMWESDRWKWVVNFSCLGIGCFALVSCKPIWLAVAGSLCLLGMLSYQRERDNWSRFFVESTFAPRFADSTLGELNLQDQPDDIRSDLEVHDFVSESEEELPMLADNTIKSQSTRSVFEEDCMNLTCRVIIPAGADRQVVHVAICPAMETIPSVDAFVVSGADARVRVTNRQKFGLRLEVITGQTSAQPVESIIEVISRAKLKEAVCRPRREAA